jgi:hypothetical protein
LAASCSKGQVADLVDDDQPVAAEPGELCWQPADAVGFGEAGDPVDRGGEQNAVAVMGGDDPEGGGEVGLAGAGRAEQHDVAGLGQERPRGERGDLLAHGGLVVPVEVVEGLAGREPGPADALGGARRVAGGDFSFEHRGQVVLVRPTGVPGLISETGDGLGDPRCFEGGGQVVDLLEGVGGGLLFGGHHATSNPSIPNARS